MRFGLGGATGKRRPKRNIIAAPVAAAFFAAAGCACEDGWRYLEALDPVSAAFADYTAQGTCRAAGAGVWSDQAAELSERADQSLLVAAQRDAEAACQRLKQRERQRALDKRRHWRDTVGPGGLYSQLK